jgi:hypothetical protein
MLADEVATAREALAAVSRRRQQDALGLMVEAEPGATGKIAREFGRASWPNPSLLLVSDPSSAVRLMENAKWEDRHPRPA